MRYDDDDDAEGNDEKKVASKIARELELREEDKRTLLSHLLAVNHSP